MAAAIAHHTLTHTPLPFAPPRTETDGAYYPTQLMVSVPDAPMQATGNPIQDNAPVRGVACTRTTEGARMEGCCARLWTNSGGRAGRAGGGGCFITSSAASHLAVANLFAPTAATR